MFKIDAEKRDLVGKRTQRLRDAGRMPAVFYGPKESATAISVSERDFIKLWRDAGESSIVELSGVGDAKEVLIHCVDVDPVTGAPRHADFYVIEKGKKVQVDVPLIFAGTAPAVKDLGGTLVKVLHEIEIEALPKDLPHDITVDVGALVDFDAQIKVKDVSLPHGVSVLTDAEEVVALASEVKEEKEEEGPVATPDLSSIEVEKKGKDENAEGVPSPSDGSEQEGS